MKRRITSFLIPFVVVAVLCSCGLAACPSADLTGDCFVDYEDFALMAAQWLTTDPCILDDMVLIPGGAFQMGDSLGDGWVDELPVHTVTLDSFYVGRCEVTNRQYCDYLNSTLAQGLITVTNGVVYQAGSSCAYCDTHTSHSYSQIDYNDVSKTFAVRTKGEPPRDMSDDPMVMVTWYGAAAYCNWRSEQLGKELCYNPTVFTPDLSKDGFRLPTEAEWELAARGGLVNKRFPWGDTITQSQANYYAQPSSYTYDKNPTQGYHPTYAVGDMPYTAPVGSFSANGYGPYDMARNAWEWCNDWWQSDYYGSSPYYNPPGPTGGSYRVLRGGAWGIFADVCRVAFRYFCTPALRYSSLGFRCVLDLE